MPKKFGVRVLLLAVLAAGSVWAQDAIAPTGAPNSITDSSPHTRKGGLVAMAEYDWWLGAGLVLRYDIPILPDGFIPSINDSFELEPGVNLDYGFGYLDYGGYLAVTPQVMATWTFHFSDRFAAYALVSLGYHIGIVGPGYVGVPSYYYSWFYVDAGAGIKLKLSDAISFRAELTENDLRAGFQFNF